MTVFVAVLTALWMVGCASTQPATVSKDEEGYTRWIACPSEPDGPLTFALHEEDC